MLPALSSLSSNDSPIFIVKLSLQVNTRKEIGCAVNPKSFLPTEMKNKTRVTLVTNNVAVNGYFPGMEEMN